MVVVSLIPPLPAKWINCPLLLAIAVRGHSEDWGRGIGVNFYFKRWEDAKGDVCVSEAEKFSGMLSV